ncbi:MAG: 30S ribosomal protein S15 [Bacteroidales bacterium]|nr:30S ribosomal protein S15 [Bacteroidales bacterium]MBS3775264.1 30S ribosomal protein S15 [Bacteroidales bacterium]
MSLKLEDKKQIFKDYGNSENDTGSPESQIALFTQRITDLTSHLKTHKKDFGTQRALLQLVGKRRRLLNYLKRKDIERYRNIVKQLKLRK